MEVKERVALHRIEGSALKSAMPFGAENDGLAIDYELPPGSLRLPPQSRYEKNSRSATLVYEIQRSRAPPSRAAVGGGALILTRSSRAFTRLRDRPRPTWHGSGYPLARAPVLSRFGAWETTTAAPMNQNYTLASRPQTSRVTRGWAVLSRGTFSGLILLNDV
jgi:hypothetical protein